MARKHPRNITYQEIEDLVIQYRNEAYTLSLVEITKSLESIKERWFWYSLQEKHHKAYFLWVKEKVYEQVHEQKMKADIRSRKIAIILLDE